MELIRTIAAYTDHDCYGKPIEVTAVELHCAPILSPEQVEIAKRKQEKRLRAAAKRMPHHYWNAADTCDATKG